MPRRLPRSRTLKGDPKLAHYDSGGGVAGEPPIVLLHGASLRSEDWENIFPRLATRYRAIAYDARGHGKSGRAPRYELAELVDDLLRVLREIAKGPAMLIGHSIGGATALVAAAREPTLVRGLVLEDPWLARYRDGWRADYFRALRKALDQREDPKAFARALGTIALPEPGPRGERTMGEVRGFYAVERIVTYFSAVDPAFVERMVVADSAGTAAIAEAAARVTCPVLLLAAEPRSSALADGEPDRLVHSLKDAKLMRFPGVGHRIHGLRPEPFIEALEPFLRRVRTAA